MKVTENDEKGKLVLNSGLGSSAQINPTPLFNPTPLLGLSFLWGRKNRVLTQHAHRTKPPEVISRSNQIEEAKPNVARVNRSIPLSGTPRRVFPGGFAATRVIIQALVKSR
ncbi:hypothetical protein CA13_41890 [Planctomycetes bacterium CA13]|uniref:Uncharacterized protein n=1 Tax=Novipirellula herctigrandis TaxID=2527986 RepID=A0A5C5Z6K2_9BACT|nr:hypothetical protein CA13_41890 [Planctomycetes bacterium CA13]